MELNARSCRCLTTCSQCACSASSSLFRGGSVACVKGATEAVASRQAAATADFIGSPRDPALPAAPDARRHRACRTQSTARDNSSLRSASPSRLDNTVDREALLPMMWGASAPWPTCGAFLRQKMPGCPSPCTLRRTSSARMKLTALVAGVETNLHVQPIQPVEHGLLIESVSRVIPKDRLGARRGCVQLLRIRCRYQVVEPAALQQQRGGRRVPDESYRLYGCHRLEPVDTRRAGQTGHLVVIFRTGEVRHETTVSDDEHRGFDAPFDADEQRTHRTAVADAQVGDARIVHVGPCAQHVDGPLQILDQLDLLGPILSAEPDGLSTAAGKGGIDRDRDRAVLREQLPDARHLARIAGHAVQEHHPGAQTRACDRIEQQSGYRSAVRSAERDGADLHAIVRGFDRLLQVQRTDRIGEEVTVWCGRRSSEIRTCDGTGTGDQVWLRRGGARIGRGPRACGKEQNDQRYCRLHETANGGVSRSSLSAGRLGCACCRSCRRCWCRRQRPRSAPPRTLTRTRRERGWACRGGVSICPSGDRSSHGRETCRPAPRRPRRGSNRGP